MKPVWLQHAILRSMLCHAGAPPGTSLIEFQRVIDLLGLPLSCSGCIGLSGEHEPGCLAASMQLMDIVHDLATCMQEVI